MHQLAGSLWSHSKLKTVQTLCPVTPFGRLVQHIPWRLTSPNAIALEHTLTAFIIGVVIGMRRFAHTEPGGADRALHAMLGL